MAGRRIALICAGEAALGGPVASLAGRLAGNGDRVAVVAPRGFAERHGLNGAVTVATVNFPAVADVLGDATTAWRLRPMLRGRVGTGPDVVHAFGTRAGLAAALSKVNGVPLVVSWWRDPQTADSNTADRLRSLPDRLVARRADVNLCATGDLVSAVLRLGGADARPVAAGVLETVAAPGIEAADSEAVASVDALYRELTGR